MTSIAVISDIHGNLHALEAVLEEIRRLRLREIICLGDIVGYGPFPGECLDLVMARCRHSVRGNHDEAAYNLAAAATFNGNALRAIRWTHETMRSDQLDLLRLLPEVTYVEEDVMCIHNCPVPGPSDYIHDSGMAARAFRGVDVRVCLVGHTHVPAVFEAPSANVEDYFKAADIAAFPLMDGQSLQLKAGRRYICNPGSVGQPRDNDPRASFGVLNTRRWTFTIRRVEYDIDAAQDATHAAGLPPILADRLALGA